MDKFYQFIIEQREKHMEERDKRDVPEVGVCSFLGRQAVGGKPAHTESKEDRGTGSESTPRLQLPLPDLQLLRLDHAPALLAFERENRAYFAASVPDRGDEFFAEFDTRYAQLLAWQAAGTDYLHLLVAEGGEVVGRVNLTEVADGTAELGYRIAQKAAGQGLATVSPSIPERYTENKNFSHNFSFFSENFFLLSQNGVKTTSKFDVS